MAGSHEVGRSWPTSHRRAGFAGQRRERSGSRCGAPATEACRGTRNARRVHRSGPALVGFQRRCRGVDGKAMSTRTIGVSGLDTAPQCARRLFVPRRGADVFLPNLSKILGRRGHRAVGLSSARWPECLCRFIPRRPASIAHRHARSLVACKCPGWHDLPPALYRAGLFRDKGSSGGYSGRDRGPSRGLAAWWVRSPGTRIGIASCFTA